MFSSRTRASLGALATSAIALLILAPACVVPYFEDSALVAVVARHLLRGARLYVDVFDHKLPAVYWETAARLAVWGRSSLALRGHEFAHLIVFGHTTGWVAGRLVQTRRASVQRWCVLTVAALGSSAMWGLPERGQTEFLLLGWIGASTGLALLSCEREGPSAWRFAAVSGCALAWAAFMKPQAFAAAPMILTSFWWGGPRARRLRQGAIRCAAWCSAALTLWTASLVVLSLRGELGALRDLLFVHQPSYLAARPFSLTQLVPPVPELTSVRALLVFGALLLGLTRLEGHSRDRTPAVLLVFAPLFAAYASFVASRWQFDYHAIPFMVALGPLTGLGLDQLAEVLGRRWSTKASVVVAGCFAFTVANDRWRADAEALYGVIVGERSLAAAWSRNGRERDYFDYSGQVDIARALDRRLFDNEQFTVINLAAVTYLEARSSPACRHLVTVFGYMPSYPTRAGVHREIVRCITTAEPKIIVVRSNDRFPWFGLPNPSAERVWRDPELGPILRSRYHEVERVGDDAVLFERCCAQQERDAERNTKLPDDPSQ